MYRSFIKRGLDIVSSLLGLAVLSPALLLLALAVRLKLGSPVIFSQHRPGKDAKIFKLYKFRSMTSETDAQGVPLPDGERLTRFGKLLRASSLDELPELWNILKGDMSVVGPRPLLTQYLPLYDAEQARRHEVRPGLTGLAQVNGRNAISWPEKFRLDCEYVDGVSFWLDAKIMLATIGKVFSGSGISSATSETMEAFTGNGEEGEA
jgi:lipopolysaccharide/colanic/teichoic acid biosynthesis glycosyltransferase